MGSVHSKGGKEKKPDTPAMILLRELLHKMRLKHGPDSFSTMPNEILLEIFSNLNEIESTCLGVTSKRFYAIHREMHGTVPLIRRRNRRDRVDVSTDPDAWLFQCLECQGKYANLPCKLFVHLKSWVPTGTRYCDVCRVFTGKKWVKTKQGRFKGEFECPSCGAYERGFFDY